MKKSGFIFITSMLLLSLSSCASPNQIYKGRDMNGKERSCRQMSEDHVCTTVLTPSDNYAYQCRMNGKTAVQCGCHDWICY